jgi:hypothetical protein
MVEAASSEVDLEARLRSYLASFDEGDMVAAAGYFADGGEYLRNAILDGERGVQRFVGPEAILCAFLRRGRRPIRHELRSIVIDGSQCMAEGDLIGPERAGLFLISAVFDEHGLIERYVAATVG